MTVTNKTVKIPFSSYVELEEIRLLLMKKKFQLNKNEVLTYALAKLLSQLRNKENGN